KERVWSRTGHLSNKALGDFLRAEHDGETQVMVLAHLSEQNNHPQIARMEAASALEQSLATQPKLVVSSQTEPTELFQFCLDAAYKGQSVITRYTRPQMGAIWTEENKFKQWLEVELVTAEVLAEQGEIPADSAAALRRGARFDVKRIAEIEAEVKH